MAAKGGGGQVGEKKDMKTNKSLNGVCYFLEQ